MFKNLSKVFNSYTYKPFAEKEIRLEINGDLFDVQTDRTGEFVLEIEKEKVPSVKVYSKETGEQLPIIQDYPVYFYDTGSRFSVITDIDDTILISNTLKTFKRIRNILFISPHKRKAVEFSKKLIKKVVETGGRVFYVSKSESNLFGLISCFIRLNELPYGKICLTKFLNFNTLINKKKAKDIKMEKIEKILSLSGDKKFILIGDDTQRDMYIYARIAARFPDKIMKIYIRRTLRSLNNKRKAVFNELMALPLPVVYFGQGDEPQDEFLFVEKMQKGEL
jgi:phosphatidate phosphatase APP1